MSTFLRRRDLLLLVAKLSSRPRCQSDLKRWRPDVAARCFVTLPSHNESDSQWMALTALGASLAAAVVLSVKATDDQAPAPVASCDARRFTTQPRNVMLAERRSIRARGLTEKYKVDWNTTLGEGAYGSVYPARLAATGEKVALKKISKRYTNSSSFKAETDALLRIYDNGGHPNISGLRDIYEDFHSFFLILDLVSGGELFEHLINEGPYSEADSARLMHEVASALAFMHGVGVVHADLKPENLLLCSKNRLHGTIKIIDFGCSVIAPLPRFGESEIGDGKMFEVNATPPPAPSTGTYAYWPPERFEPGATVNAATDMWSVGVILYIMLTGVHPFDLEGKSSDQEIAEQIKANPHPPLTEEFVGHLSESAIDLITKLMEVNPEKRLTAYEMLHHPWVRGETASSEKIPDSDKKLSQFKDVRNKVEAGIFAVLVSQGHQGLSLSEAKIQKSDSNILNTVDGSANLMKRAFDVFDGQGKGFVTLEDLDRVVTERTGSQLSSNDTKEFAATQGNMDFSSFSSLFSRLKHKHFPRGHVIFNAGDTGDAMYFLNSGKVEVLTRKGQLVAILRSGDFFGEGSLLSAESKRFTTAKCATPVDVIQIKRDDFDRYVASSESTKNELRLKWRARNLDYAKNLIRLQQNVILRELTKGEVVYREGDKGMSMFRVVDTDGGELEVSHGNRVVHKYVAGDTFGESSLLFEKPRSSTVTCMSERCRLLEMRSEDFLALVESSPEMASSLRDMCRKRLFKRAVKSYSLSKNRGLSDEDIVAVFHDADIDQSGSLDLKEVRRIMHSMDPDYPIEEIQALLKHVDVDEDGNISLEEFKRLFRQFDDEKAQNVR